MTLTALFPDTGANGDALSAGNTAFDVMAFAGTGNVGVISTTFAAFGTRSALFTKTSTSGTCYVQKTISSTAFAITIPFRMTALPSADQGIIFLGNGTSQRGHVEVTATGAIRFRDDANGAQWNGTVTTSPGTMAINTTYAISVYFNMATGAARLVVCPFGSTTPVTNTDSGARTGINFGADSFTSLRVGAQTATGTTTLTAYFDTAAIEDAATGIIPAYVEALPNPSSISIVSVVDPTTVGGNGTINFAWGASVGQTTYEVAIEPGVVTSGFTADATDSASPHAFSAPAGTYTVAVRAV